MSPPEKREGVGPVSAAEQPPQKRAKPKPERPATWIGKPDDYDSDYDGIDYYCMICLSHAGHKCWDCPNRSKGMGMFCSTCSGPCKKLNDPDYDANDHPCFEAVKHCAVCMYSGDHWADDCPYRSDTDNDDAHVDDEVQYHSDPGF